MSASGIVYGSKEPTVQNIPANQEQETFQLLGRSYTLASAILSEVVEKVGIALMNVGIFNSDRDMTLGGIITTAVGIGAITIIEQKVVKNGKEAGIPLNAELITRAALRVIGGLLIIGGFTTAVAGYSVDDPLVQNIGIIVLDAGAVIGLAGLPALAKYA